MWIFVFSYSTSGLKLFLIIWAYKSTWEWLLMCTIIIHTRYICFHSLPSPLSSLSPSYFFSFSLCDFWFSVSHFNQTRWWSHYLQSLGATFSILNTVSAISTFPFLDANHSRCLETRVCCIRVWPTVSLSLQLSYFSFFEQTGMQRQLWLADLFGCDWLMLSICLAVIPQCEAFP